MASFVRMLLSLAATVFVACAFAQSGKPPYRVGILSSAPEGMSPNIGAFYQQMRDYGYVEGTSVVFERRYGDGREDRLAAVAGELAQQKLDVIVALGPSASAAARSATTTIPVVMSTHDVLEQGLVTSLSRPGANVTGWSIESSESGKKQLSLLRETIPGISRVAVLSNPAMPGHAKLVDKLRDGAAEMGMRLYPMSVPGSEALDEAFAAMREQRVEAVFVIADPAMDRVRVQVAELAAQKRLPAIYPWRMYAEAGGLMSYGPSLPDLLRRSASYVHRILRGAKPGDLPVELPDRYELVLNQKAARALGITFPPSLQARADDQIR